ncbi:MAG: hypothetical protein HDR15_08750 [Lachnospiraceae bacterium]|nr:hypothetical protein [Lachnospiraceae bacterium]
MKQKRYGVNVGSSSLLIIFVVVCLVSFAALSIVSANSDYKLTKRMAERETNYYNACNDAYRALASIDRTLLSLYESSDSEDDFYAQAGYTKSFTYPVSDIQSLRVVLQIHYPRNDADPRYTITEWQIVTIGTLDYDQSLPVIQ